MFHRTMLVLLLIGFLAKGVIAIATLWLIKAVWTYRCLVAQVGDGWGSLKLIWKLRVLRKKIPLFFFAENRGVGGFFITLKALVNLYKQTQLGGRRHCWWWKQLVYNSLNGIWMCLNRTWIDSTRSQQHYQFDSINSWAGSMIFRTTLHTTSN